uniref:CCHC-type domain-containing protein n=1 Tax=Panagrellus redivivus TaxID=6233 RepID=A0A7E4W0T8_PANRE
MSVSLAPEEDALSKDDCTQDALRSVIDKIIHQLNETDRLFTGNGDKFRNVRSELMLLAKQFDNGDIDINELSISAANIVNTIGVDAVTTANVKAYTVGPSSEQRFPRVAGTEAPVTQWSQIYTKLKRTDPNSQYESSHTTGQFQILPTIAFRCSNCISNDHNQNECTAFSIRCACCWKYGHTVAVCSFHLCVHCQRYGHSRRFCPEISRPPRCINCFQNTHEHTGRTCTFESSIYCRHCGGSHNHKHCKNVRPELAGLCFKHKGAHTFVNCPKPSND